jgi:hypothetical protein
MAGSLKHDTFQSAAIFLEGGFTATGRGEVISTWLAILKDSFVRIDDVAFRSFHRSLNPHPSSFAPPTKGEALGDFFLSPIRRLFWANSFSVVRLLG